MGNIIKKQHYVWRKYLEPWAQNDKIWCQRGNKVFSSSLMGIANETYFYEVTELNATEQEILLLLINQYPKENRSLITDILMRYNIISKISDKTRKNGLEDYYSKMENNAVDLYEKLYKKDLSFINNDFVRSNFYGFLGLQYTRTKKMLVNSKNVFNIIPIPEKFKGKFNPDNINRVIGLISAETIGNWIYVMGNIYFFDSDYELITCDQPIINVHASSYESMEPPKRLELYYPITPNLALFITDRKISNRILKKEDAIFYNNLMKQKSHEQIYAKTPDLFSVL